MSTRIITSFFIVSIILGTLYAGKTAFWALIAFLIVLCSWEFASMIGYQNHFFHGVITLCASSFFLFYISGFAQWTSLGILVTMIIATLSVFYLHKSYPQSSLFMILFGSVYVGWSLTHLSALYALDNGALVVFMLFLGMWSSDSGAYLVGMFFGKHPLAPELSPKKTIEGSLGGIGATVLILWIVNSLLQITNSTFIVVLAIFLSIMGQIGDLLESTLKRFFQVKDSGHLLPGHGGVLDRFDSMIFVAPFIYHYFSIFYS